MTEHPACAFLRSGGGDATPYSFGQHHPESHDEGAPDPPPPPPIKPALSGSNLFRLLLYVYVSLQKRVPMPSLLAQSQQQTRPMW